MNLNEEYGDPDEPWKRLRIYAWSTLQVSIITFATVLPLVKEHLAQPDIMKKTPKINTLPAIQYIPCLSMTTLFVGPAAIAAPIVASLGPAN